MALKRRQSHEQPAPIRRAAPLGGRSPFHPDQVRTDVYLRVREVMERHNLSASGAVHHLLRERFSLPPLPPFDQQPIPTDSTHG